MKYSRVEEVTDKWLLLCSYDRDTNEIIPLNFADTNWRVQRFEYLDTDLIYLGVHEKIRALTDDLNWRIWKYSWIEVGGKKEVKTVVSMIEGPVIGSWDNRELLDWE